MSVLNSGHGHVWERPDGVNARCGGPGICAECSRDQAQLLKEALDERERRAAQIAGDRIEYFVVFIGPSGYGSMSVETPAPGIETYEHVLRLQAGISKEFQAPVVILNWRQLRAASRVLAPVPSGIVVAPR
jgi:hypothetical protein